MPCVAEVVNRSLKADCTDFTKGFGTTSDTKGGGGGGGPTPLLSHNSLDLGT